MEESAKERQYGGKLSEMNLTCYFYLLIQTNLIYFNYFI